MMTSCPSTWQPSCCLTLVDGCRSRGPTHSTPWLASAATISDPFPYAVVVPEPPGEEADAQPAMSTKNKLIAAGQKAGRTAEMLEREELRATAGREKDGGPGIARPTWPSSRTSGYCPMVQLSGVLTNVASAVTAAHTWTATLLFRMSTLTVLPLRRFVITMVTS